jgi:hypothetical protein
MIVKNEAHIILNTLEMLSKYIDYWVICDTGSTDDTIKLIKTFFKNKNIEGELYQDEWEDFGRNRTKALERAYDKCDYIWVFDADDLIVGDIVFPENMDADLYYLRFGKGFTYVRGQIFRSNLEWCYRGVLHEYAECKNKINLSKKHLEGDYYIESRRLGGRNVGNPNKYLNDANTLIKGLEKDPDLKSRYYFYIGRSFFDHGDFNLSIEWYKKRVNEGGWIEEVFYSNLEIGKAMERLKKSDDEITKQYLTAHSNINDRIEPLYQLGLYFKNKYNESNPDSNYLEKAIKYFEMGKKIKYNSKYGLFIYYDIYEWKNDFELANVYLLSSKFDECLKICEELISNNSLRTNMGIFDAIENLRYKAISYNEEELVKYNKEKIDKIIDNLKKKTDKKITLSITTCKRLDLFKKTINSFINCCKDIELIDHWICIDDNSSKDDKEFMEWEYPFFEFYFKDSKNKGHVESMNMIINLVKTPYLIHIEDDWLFIEKTYYIKPSLNILESTTFNYIDSEGYDLIENNKYKIMQVLFNRNYSETFDRGVIHGGFLAETIKPKFKFVIHEHNNPKRNIQYSNCAYWPHYSFRPSVINTDIFKTLNYYEECGFFERKYADKYYLNKYISCFFDKITSIHLGKKTWETTGSNAYELNGINQFKNIKNNNHNELLQKYKFIPNKDSFSNDICYFDKSINELSFLCEEIDDALCFNSYGFIKNKINDSFINLSNKFNNPDGLFIHLDKLHREIICLNLVRRPDRKDNMIKIFDKICLRYKFINSVDGENVEPNESIINLFKNNDFGSRSGVIGCALTHKNIWSDLIEDKIKDYYIIFEDDIHNIHKDFKNYLIQIQHKLKLIEWDVIFLSYSTYDNNKDIYAIKNYDESIEKIDIIKFDKNIYIGGFFSYLISKSGAKKLLKYIETNGIKHGIDYLIKIVPNLNIYQLNKFITSTNWVQSINSTVDSDIQKNYNFIDIYSDDDFLYYRNLDSGGNDLKYLKNKSVDELKKICLENKDCLGFNTLGFLKSKISNKLEKSPYFNNIVDGIYIKKSYLNKKIRVKLLCNWTNSKQLCEEWKHMCKKDLVWDDLEFVYSDDNIDFYVIINKPSNNEYYEPLRTIILHMEPWCFDSTQNWGVKTWGEWAKPNNYTFLQVRSHDKFVNNCLWQFPITWEWFKNNQIVKNNNFSNVISSICSSKYFDPGHIKRIDFLKFIENKNEIKLHIYNEDNQHNFKNWMGKGKAIANVNKNNGIVPYKYYFMCENNSEKNFITEKIWEPIITETLVFYWGCPNVSDYINPLAYVQLDMNDFEKSYNIIKESIENDLWEQRIKYIREEKQKILDYYNFFPTIHRELFDNYKFDKLDKFMTNEYIVVKKFLYEFNSKFTNHQIKNLCFIHSCNTDSNGILFLNNLFEFFTENNIFKYFDAIFINNIGDEIPYGCFDIFSNNIFVCNYSTKTDYYENITLKILYNLTNTYENNVNILYLHTKGVSRENNNNIRDWIYLMLNFLLKNIDYSINLLKNYDSIGVNYLKYDWHKNYNPHWSGNFWWSKSSYIKNLDISKLKIKEDAEWFILSNYKSKYYELFGSEINHYLQSFPPIKYINYIKNNNLLNYIKNEYYPSAWIENFEFAIWLINSFRPKKIVELGVDYGSSTFIMASQLKSDEKIYGVDCFNGDKHAGERNTYDIVIKTKQYLLNLGYLESYDNLQLIKGYFNDVANDFEQNSIDLLHIDGLHDYNSVSNDFNTWFDKTSYDSIILFHDTNSFPNDVGKFFESLDYPKINFKNINGLGVLSRNKNIIEFIKTNWIDKQTFPNHNFIPYKIFDNYDL